MANNCLVTKLKSVVANDNLEKMGCIRIYASAMSDGASTFGLQGLNISSRNGEIVIKTTNCSLTDNITTLTNPLSEFSIVNNSNGYGELGYGGIYNSGSIENVYVEVSNKYCIENLFIGGRLYIKTPNLLEYTALKSFCLSGTSLADASNSNTVGDISTILHSSKNTLITLQIRNSGIKGKYMSTLGECKSLTYMNIIGTQPDAEDLLTFIQKQREVREIASGSIRFFGGFPSSITFNGNSMTFGWIPDEWSGTINWDATGCFVKNSSARKIQCYGYSDEEIATKTASGGEWEGYTITKAD